MSDELSGAPDSADNLVIVSGDTHVGPRLREDLWDYCPANYRDQFEEFISASAYEAPPFDPNNAPRSKAAAAYAHRVKVNQLTSGHYDVHQRLKDMDWEGIAAEVIFHGSQNEIAFPFVGGREWAKNDTDRNHELTAVGYRMYNRWLADFCSVEPERHVGLIYAPMWDVDLAIKEIEWAADQGLKGVNFPAPRGGINEYDDPTWEPFWAACSERGLSLLTHAGVPMNPVFGPQRWAMTRLEVGGWPARRGMNRLIFGGIFERYPNLNLILTEQTRGWWTPTKREFDQVYEPPSDALRAQLPKRPSEYMQSNVFIGASGGLMPPVEVEEAIREGFASNMVWGSDYPHGEGTYKYPESEFEESSTRRYLRWVFETTPLEETRRILGGNGIRAFGMDAEALAAVAARIGPSVTEITTPLTEIPEEWSQVALDIYA